MKLMEKSVWAVARLAVDIPVESKRLLKAEMEASVVRLTLGMWYITVFEYSLVVLLPMKLYA